MRTLGWDGYRNVRDLGGLPTPLARSGVTATGRVARGPRRELLTTTGLDDARRWGLRTVVDLRNADEMGQRDGDPTAAWDGVRIVHAPTEDPSHAGFLEACGPILDSPTYWAHNVRLLPGHVRDALVAVAAAEPGVLVHCSGGRDRTGMVSALLLAHAGVPAPHVAADWGQSVHVMAQAGHDRQSTWDRPTLDAFVARMTPVVEDFAARVDGTLDDVGLDREARQTLRALLVAS